MLESTGQIAETLTHDCNYTWHSIVKLFKILKPTLRSLSPQGEYLLHVAGGEAVQSWAGSLERFLGEFSHGRGLGILHPNLNGGISFARQVPCGEQVEVSFGDEEEVSIQTEGVSTQPPTLRGLEDGEKPERLVNNYKDALLATVSCFCWTVGVCGFLSLLACVRWL